MCLREWYANLAIWLIVTLSSNLCCKDINQYSCCIQFHFLRFFLKEFISKNEIVFIWRDAMFCFDRINQIPRNGWIEIVFYTCIYSAYWDCSAFHIFYNGTATEITSFISSAFQFRLNVFSSEVSAVSFVRQHCYLFSVAVHECGNKDYWKWIAAKVYYLWL